MTQPEVIDGELVVMLERLRELIDLFPVSADALEEARVMVDKALAKARAS